jgi:hypothetical protein
MVGYPSGHGAALIGDVSGTAVTYGRENVFDSNNVTDVSAGTLSETKLVIVYNDGGNRWYGTAVVGNVSDNTITYVSEGVFNPAMAEYASVTGLSSTKFIVVYGDDGNNNRGTAIIGDIYENTIIFGSEYLLPTSASASSLPALSSNKFLLIYQHSYNGIGLIGKVASGNLVGIAREPQGVTVPVIIGGVSDVHSGLTPGEVYYSDASGSLTTGVTDYRIGLAISSTEIVLHTDIDNPDQFFGDMVFENNFRITEGVSKEGLILKNQLNREILTISEEGNLNINGLTFRDQRTQKTVWRMFEDEEDLYLENLKTGKVYNFVLEEAENETNVNGTSNLKDAIKELQTENEALKERLEALERIIQQHQFAVVQKAINMQKSSSLFVMGL